MIDDRLEGRVLFWAAKGGQITVDVLAAPAGASGAAGGPIALHGSLPWSPLGAAILTTLERWADQGEPIRLESRPGRDGGSRLRMASDRTWLVVELVGADGRPELWSEEDLRSGNGVSVR